MASAVKPLKRATAAKRTADETYLFGDSDASSSEDEVEVKQVAKDAAWEDNDGENLKVSLNKRNRSKKLKTDDDDDIVTGAEYEKRLRESFKKFHGEDNWATQGPEQDSESEDEEAMALLRSSGNLTKSNVASGPLDTDWLHVRRYPDANVQEPSQCRVSVVKFHPNSEVLFTAGSDKTLRLFHVDRDENAKLASHHYAKFPITSAQFAMGGKKIFLTGLSASMYTYDVELGVSEKILALGGRREDGALWGLETCDRANLFSVCTHNGNVHLADQRTRHLIRTVHMSGDAVASVFHPTRDTMFTCDATNGIYEWDFRTGRCVGKTINQSATKLTSMAIAPKGPSHLIVGTNSGNVDVFDTEETLKHNQQPFKSLTNLTAHCSTLAFHPEGEVFCAASKNQKDHLKMFHRPTYKCFRNWPSATTPLKYVQGIDFAQKGGLFAVGNDSGRVLLYSLWHYDRA